MLPESRNDRITDRLKTVYPTKTTFCGGRGWYKNEVWLVGIVPQIHDLTSTTVITISTTLAVCTGYIEEAETNE